MSGFLAGYGIDKNMLGATGPDWQKRQPPQSGAMNMLQKVSDPQQPTPQAWSPPPQKQKYNMLGETLKGFQRGFDPSGAAAREQRTETDGQKRAQQTLALMQQQRALPEAQRAGWFEQNKAQIAEITGANLLGMPANPADFTDQALDGHIAMISGQLGVAPPKPKPEPYTLGLGERRFNPDGSMAAENPKPLEPEKPPAPPGWTEVEMGDGNIYAVDKNDPSKRFKLGPAPAKTGDGESGPDFGNENSLRTQYLGQAKNFQTVREAYSRLSAAREDGAGDIALVYGYMKMLDPTSVVREGEFATAANAGGVPDQVMNLYNKVIKGERLPPTVRQSFKAQAKNIYQTAEQQYAPVYDFYRGQAQSYGMDPSIIMDMRPGREMYKEQGRAAMNNARSGAGEGLAQPPAPDAQSSIPGLSAEEAARYEYLMKKRGGQ